MRILREDQEIKNVKILIKQQHHHSTAQQQHQLSEASSASSSASTAATFTMEPIECHLKQIESNLYECEFEPKSIDRHFVEIYFDNQLINFGLYSLVLYIIFSKLLVRYISR